MSGSLVGLERDALEELSKASSRDALQQARARYLGRKGEVAGLLKGLGALSPEERKGAGEAINSLKTRLEEAFDRALEELDEKDKKHKIESERIDVTLPGRYLHPGRLHPVTQVLHEIEEIFLSIGFDVAEGPEVELDYYNFEALNFPKDHPARDMQDTFFVSEEVMLRTHVVTRFTGYLDPGHLLDRPSRGKRRGGAAQALRRRPLRPGSGVTR